MYYIFILSIIITTQVFYIYAFSSLHAKSDVKTKFSIEKDNKILPDDVFPDLLVMIKLLHTPENCSNSRTQKTNSKHVGIIINEIIIKLLYFSHIHV